MASQLLQQALHVDNYPIVKDVIVAIDVEVSCCDFLERPLDMLLDFLASLVFLLSVGFHNGIDSFFDGLLVAFFTDFDDLSNHNILQAILKQVGSGPILLHVPVLNNLLLSALLDLS